MPDLPVQRDDLPTKRVEIVMGPYSYGHLTQRKNYSVYLRADSNIAATATVGETELAALLCAEQWSIATGWPLVIDGKVVKPK